jgi:hypothetical protein
MQTTIISKKRGILIEEMEKLLLIWIEDLQQQRMPMSQMLIQEKVLSLFEDVKRKHGERVGGHTFFASHGWFQRFKARAKLHDIKVTGEAASADTVAATKFLKTSAEIIKTRITYHNRFLMWTRLGCFGGKKMPDRSYIAQNEKTMPGFEISKHRLTLLLRGNVAGD